MSRRNKIMLILAVLLVVGAGITLGVSQAYLREAAEGDSTTDIVLNNCARLTFSDNNQSINLTNTAPMSDIEALRKTPYEFTVSSTCDEGTSYKIYLGVINIENSLGANYVKYALIDKETKTNVATGILSNASDATEDFDENELNQINNQNDVTSIYTIYEGKIRKNMQKTYQLYVWIDGAIDDTSTMDKSFQAKLLAKSSGTYGDLYNTCEDETLACQIAKKYGTDSTLYYHNEELINGANDNSYRFSGANEEVNNWVCFGSGAESYDGSTSSICNNDNLYRIIGVYDNSGNNEYQVRLIKGDYLNIEQLGIDSNHWDGMVLDDPSSDFGEHYTGHAERVDTYYWENHTSYNNRWQDNDLQKRLNNEYLNYNLSWSDMIAESTWFVGGIRVIDMLQSPLNHVYSYEVGNNRVQVGSPGCFHNGTAENCTEDDILFKNVKVGILYLSDFGFAADSAYWTYTLENFSEDVNYNHNWMFLGGWDWSMSRVLGTNNEVYGIYSDPVSYDSFLDHWVGSSYYGGIRPVFNLKSSIILTGGTGTHDNPYVISDSDNG